MSFAIHSLNNLHVGFLLLNQQDGNGHCIFQCLPFEAGMKDSLEAKLLTKLESLGEFKFEWKQNEHAGASVQPELGSTLDSAISQAMTIELAIHHPSLPLQANVKNLELEMAGVRFKLVKLERTVS
jgi:hypothetical protein